ncbi:hypothetical protein N656DRAFT_844372 [Canariomyces notabilis]|uniref:Uncharacterized protein n=1 Tax=Canariomyces notabilis TaxID=2074819 RepID=A0AAN6TFD5_9PEZI|nr:hypothetical protein N656DRAFT_844372 [Canariomyces arenarius]
MLPPFRKLAAFALLVRGIEGTRNQDHHDADVTTVYDPTCTGNVTVVDTTTVHVTHYVDVMVNRTTTNTVSTCITEYTTTTLLFTVAVTETATNWTTITNTDTDSVTVTTTDTDSVTVTTTDTDSVTITNTDTDSVTITNTETDSVTITNTETDSVTVTNTETDLATITNTETDSATITNTETTTTTVPATVTTYTTQTIFSTTVDPCPKSCSISAETVNLYFWPTDRPYTYPSTYVDPKMDYTFTSPSVYMFIPTARGINTRGEPAGPSTTAWMLPLDLYEVSTIAPGLGGNVTRQLTLADLGTDCPQTADPTAIATMVDSRCDPMLAAPSQVRSWAYPCNACGRFGLFDPPYAVPTLTGSLVVVPPTATVTATATASPAPPVSVTVPVTQTVVTPTPPASPLPPPPPPPPSAPVDVGVLVVAYYAADGRPMGTITNTVTGISGTVTNSVVLPAAATLSSGTIGTIGTDVPVSSSSVGSVPVPGTATSGQQSGQETGSSSGSGSASPATTRTGSSTGSSAAQSGSSASETTSASLTAAPSTASGLRDSVAGSLGAWLMASAVVVFLWF